MFLENSNKKKINDEATDEFWNLVQLFGVILCVSVVAWCQQLSSFLILLSEFVMIAVINGDICQHPQNVLQKANWKKQLKFSVRQLPS